MVFFQILKIPNVVLHRKFCRFLLILRFLVVFSMHLNREVTNFESRYLRDESAKIPQKKMRIRCLPREHAVPTALKSMFRFWRKVFSKLVPQFATRSTSIVWPSNYQYDHPTKQTCTIKDPGTEKSSKLIVEKWWNGSECFDLFGCVRQFSSARVFPSREISRFWYEKHVWKFEKTAWARRYSLSKLSDFIKSYTVLKNAYSSSQVASPKSTKSPSFQPDRWSKVSKTHLSYRLSLSSPVRVAGSVRSQADTPSTGDEPPTTELLCGKAATSFPTMMLCSRSW